MKIDPCSPIGIFDSGIGGLTVLRELQRKLPNERFVYLGDTARVPYGTKSPQTVIRYSLNIARALYAMDIKYLVVACNTASAHAMGALREAYPALPMTGVVEPGADAAAEATQSGSVAVLATDGTIGSRAYQDALAVRGVGTVIAKACPLFVPLAEEGWCADDITRAIAERYLTEVRESGVDCAILGCTHYPLLAETIAAVLGPNIRLVDSARTTAERVAIDLAAHSLENPGVEGGSLLESVQFLLTDINERFATVGARFLGRELPEMRYIDLIA